MSRDSAEVLVRGGIGGLATGYALASAGYTVWLLERAQQLGDVEAEVQLTPNVIRFLVERGLLGGSWLSGCWPAGSSSPKQPMGGAYAPRLEDAFRERCHATHVVAHRSDVHRILLDRVPPRRDRASYQPHRRAGRDGNAWTRTYCIGGEVVESQAVLAADRLASVRRLSIIDDGLICSSYVVYRGAIPVTDVRTEVAWFWIGPRCHSPGVGCAVARSSTRSRRSAAGLLRVRQGGAAVVVARPVVAYVRPAAGTAARPGR
ncbi:MAG: hypothetical protein M3460_21035 [Actinomycetota bacterium]|nr:hypothetical protein [Actinomycetota bacterium]